MSVFVHAQCIKTVHIVFECPLIALFTNCVNMYKEKIQQKSSYETKIA